MLSLLETSTLFIFFLRYCFYVNHFCVFYIHNFLSCVLFPPSARALFRRTSNVYCARQHAHSKLLILFSLEAYLPFAGFVPILLCNLALMHLNAIDIDSLFHQVTLQTKMRVFCTQITELYTQKISFK